MGIELTEKVYHRTQDGYDERSHRLVCDFCGQFFQGATGDPGTVVTKAQVKGWHVVFSTPSAPGKWQCPRCPKKEA